jgi:hypothetical protein
MIRMSVIRTPISLAGMAIKAITKPTAIHLPVPEISILPVTAS